MKQKQQNETKNEKGECHENVAALEWRSFTDGFVLILNYWTIR